MPPPQSTRESILEHLRVDVFPSVIRGDRYNHTIKHVERGRRNPEDLGKDKFPAVFIVSTHEKTVNINQIEYESDMNVVVVGYVQNSRTGREYGEGEFSAGAYGSSITGVQRDLGDLIADVRNALELDPLLGGRVKWIEISEVTTDDGDILPYGGFVMSVSMQFVDRRSLQ